MEGNYKNILGEKIPCTLEVLSPVHIGSGIKLAKGFNFISEGGTTKIVPQSEIEEYLRNNPEEIQNFDRPDYRPLEILKKINKYRCYNIYCNVSDILEFIRDAKGNPFIPGSSVKGSLRTSIISNKINSLNENEKSSLLGKTDFRGQKFAAKEIEKIIFGEDSNKNVMRLFNIFDIFFYNKDIDLYKINVISLKDTQGTDFLWKVMRRNQNNTSNHSQATSIYSEMLQPGSKANFSFKIDKFLFDNSKADSELKLKNYINSILIENLINDINDYTLRLLKSEIDFFTKLNSSNNLDKVVKSLNKMKTDLENIIFKKEQSVIMRISWGSGWKFMTGDFIPEEILVNIKSRLRLGKNNFNFFPKSRKIVFDGNQPDTLAGFIRIKFFETLDINDIQDNKTSEETAAKKPAENDPLSALKGKFKVTKK